MIRQAQCVQTAKDQNPSTTLIIERTFQLGGGHTRNDMLSVADKAKKYSKCFGGTKTLPQADAPVITVSPEPEPVYSRYESSTNESLIVILPALTRDHQSTGSPRSTQLLSARFPARNTLKISLNGLRPKFRREQVGTQRRTLQYGRGLFFHLKKYIAVVTIF